MGKHNDKLHKVHPKVWTSGFGCLYKTIQRLCRVMLTAVFSILFIAADIFLYY